MRHIGKTDESTIVQVTISIRRRPGHVPMPKFEDYIGCPPRTRLSVDEFAKKHGACQDDVDAVLRHTFQHGLQYIDHHLARRHLRVRGTIGQLNQCFGIDTQDYERDDSYHGTYTYRKHDPIKVPNDLKDRIVAVHGIGNGRRPHPPALAGDPPVCLGLTPPFIMGLYQNVNVPATGQNIGIFGWQGSNASDWQATIEQWGISLPTVTHIAVDNSPYTLGNTDDQTEEVLDISMCGSFGTGAHLYVYEPNLDVDNNALTGWVDLIGRMVHPEPGDPVLDIMSFSIVFEADAENDTSLSSSTDPLFEDAAAQSISVFVATGDEGSSNYSIGGGSGNVFISYPSNSPWVTAVGGTTIGALSGDEISASNYVEWVWNDSDGEAPYVAAGGGGISTIYSPPSYQDGYTLPRSLNTGTAGRGIPDISGNASAFSGYNIITDGVGMMTGGASASCPMYAGMFARVNAYLGRNVGFLNPTLYTIGSGTLQNSPFLTSTTGSFTDSNGIVWTLTGSPGSYKAARNGTTDNTTANVINLIYYTLTRTVYQENASGNWYSWNGSSWVSLPSNTGNSLVVIRDIDGTTGGPQNNAVTQPGQAQTPGYPVEVGWDACTGLGVINMVPFAWYLANFTPPSPPPAPPTPPPSPPSPPPSPPPGPPSPAPTPTPSPAPPSSPNSLTLTWNVPSEVITNETVNYIIQYKVASDLAWSNAPVYSNPAPASGMDGVVMSNLQSNTIYAVRVNANDSRFCQQVYGTTSGAGAGGNESPHGTLMAMIPQMTFNIYPMNSITDRNGGFWQFAGDTTGLPELAGVLTYNGTLMNSEFSDIFEIIFVLYFNHTMYAMTKNQAWYSRMTATDIWIPSTDPRAGAPSMSALLSGLT